jgi:adenylate cyclase
LTREARLDPPAASFDDHLAREIVHSERLRMAILAGLLGLMIVFISLVYALAGQGHVRRFIPPAVFFQIISVCAVLLGYELAVRRLVGRRARQGKGAPAALRYLNAFVETSAPSVAIFLAARQIDPVYVLQSAAGFFYAVFIVLSTLRLDFRLSLFTGLVAAVQYSALSLAYMGAGGSSTAATPFEAPPFYLAKAGMLLLAGLAAGFVAHQLKRRIGNAFRTMQERQRILDAFGQQIAPAIVDELLKSGPEIASSSAFVCVMFMDIRDFTPLVENKSPQEIVALQNIVFGAAAEVVNRHHGIVNQFLGDGFMATFGAPVATGDDCGNALAAAHDLLAAVGELSRSGRIPSIRIGIGLHAGQAVAGNIGSRQRKQYSITGNVVILASRIEQLNKQFGSQILASAEVLAAAASPVQGGQALGPVHVKGHEAPIEIHRLA